MNTTDIVVPPPTSPRRLIMVTGENNNKFYNMNPNGSSFTTEWGRVDVTSTTSVYPISKWASTYKEKVKKGYKDVTDLVKAAPKAKAKSGHAPISDLKIRGLFDQLMKYSKTSIAENYSIASDAVTPAQVKEAQSIVNELTNFATTGLKKDKANKYLLDLYTVIPRKMKKVQDHLIQVPVIKTADDLKILREIIDNEQKTLDVMAGQVQMQSNLSTSDDSNVPDKTLLDALGITVELGNVKDEAIVRKLMGHDASEFKAVYRVIHNISRPRYTKHLDTTANKKCDLHWHGSRNENWISILQTDLKIRPSNAVLTGAMFGHGIYFADKYRKSANYTSLRGSYWAGGAANTAFLALMDVHLGKQLEIKHHTHECYNYNNVTLRNKGEYDSVFAKGGADLINNEFIVYTEGQSTIKYLVEVGK